MRQVGEPSVEEILASIKNVIARDNRDDAAQERRERSERGLAKAAQRPGNDADEVLELDAAAVIADDPADEAGQSPLLSANVASSMRESLAALAVLSEPGVPPQIVRSGETSLEGMVREMLRPMLAQWLDANLPLMVEKLVAAEIARIAGKKG